MGTVLEFVGVWAVTLPFAFLALKGFTSELRHSEAMRQAVLAEYELRLCGELEAARANLSSAAHWVGRQDPTVASAAEAAASNLADRLGSVYPEHLPAHDGVCRLAEGQMSLLGDSGMALHYQRHDDQPIAWPNWITRVAP